MTKSIQHDAIFMILSQNYLVYEICKWSATSQAIEMGLIASLEGLKRFIWVDFRAWSQ